MTKSNNFSIKETKISFNNIDITVHKDHVYLYSASEVHKYALEFNLTRTRSTRPGNWISDKKHSSSKWHSILEQEKRYISIKHGVEEPIPLIVIGKGRYAETFMSHGLLKLYVLDCIEASAIDNKELYFVHRVKQTRSELEFSKYLTQIAILGNYDIAYQVPIESYRIDFMLTSKHRHSILIEYDEIRHKKCIEKDTVRWNTLKLLYENSIFLRVKEDEQYRFIADLALHISSNSSIRSIRKLQNKYKGYL